MEVSAAAAIAESVEAKGRIIVFDKIKCWGLL